MQRTRAAVTLAVVLAGASARGQNVDANVWSEARVLARVESRAPDVQAARAQLHAAQAVQTFGRVPILGNPTVSVRTMIGVPSDTAATYALLVGLPIDLSGQRALWSREAAWVERQAEATLQAALNDARARAREAFVDLAAADGLVRTARSRVDTARELLNRMQVRLRAQAATALDLALSEQELAQAEAEHAAAMREREQAAGRFREALDLPATAQVATPPLAPPRMPQGLTREAAVTASIAHRREARAFAASAARLRLSEDRLRAQAVAPLFVAAEVERQGNTRPGYSIGASFSWSLPILQTAQGERAVALGEAFLADTRRGLTERSIGREAAVAWNSLALRLEELQALDERAVPAAERTVALTGTLFESGAVDYFRVLLARRELFSLRARQQITAREAWRARIALDRALGGVAR